MKDLIDAPGVATEGDARHTGECRSPIFIGGQRRSGTTLMRTMLNRHPHSASVPQESHFLQDERFELFFTSSIGRWKRELSPDEVACIGSFSSETMALLGYHREVV